MLTSNRGAGERYVWVETRNQLAARLSRYDGEATMLDFEAIFAGSCDNVKVEDWAALGMARALIVARWPKGAKKAFSEKELPELALFLLGSRSPRPRQFNLNLNSSDTVSAIGREKSQAKQNTQSFFRIGWFSLAYCADPMGL